MSYSHKAWVHIQGSPGQICGGQSGIGRNFSPSTSVFSCHIHSNTAPYTFIAQVDTHTQKGRIIE